MNIKYLLLVLLCSKMALGCGYLCISCDLVTQNCYMCAPYAQRKNFADCECQNGYTDRGNGCQYSGWIEEFLIFFGIGVFFFVFVLVVYFYKKKKRAQQQQYTRMQDDGMPYGAIVPPPMNPYPVNQHNQYPAPQLPQKCSICYSDGPDCRTSCGHPYHRVCLDKWTFKTCAVCYQSVPELASK